MRTKRNQKTFSFVEVNDGSCMKGVQVKNGEEGGVEDGGVEEGGVE